MLRYCKLCKGPVHKINTVEKPVYYHCLNCDLIFMDEKYYPSWESEKERYLQHNNTLENKGYVEMFEKFMEKAIQPFVSEGSALDFGCGPGPVLKVLLERRGFKTEIYDHYFFPEPVYRKKNMTLLPVRKS